MSTCGAYGNHQFLVFKPTKLHNFSHSGKKSLHFDGARNPIWELKFLVRAASSAPLGGQYSGGNLPSKFHYFCPRITAEIKSLPPVFISTNRAHVNQHHLRELYALCNHSCHRFPTIDASGRVEPIDALKLRTALSHSSVVLSVFTKPEFVSPEVVGDWIRKVAPVTPENGRLIGFGRAVSDLGLTAAIYDVMVHPALQGRGIGRIIVQRIIRLLINRDIYDIAALCNDNERPFYRSCGFGEDVLGSTTMMYTRSTSSYYSKDQQMISAGRKLLLVPSQRELKK